MKFKFYTYITQANLAPRSYSAHCGRQSNRWNRALIQKNYKYGTSIFNFSKCSQRNITADLLLAILKTHRLYVIFFNWHGLRLLRANGWGGEWMKFTVHMEKRHSNSCCQLIQLNQSIKTRDAQASLGTPTDTSAVTAAHRRLSSATSIKRWSK